MQTTIIAMLTSVATLGATQPPAVGLTCMEAMYEPNVLEQLGDFSGADAAGAEEFRDELKSLVEAAVTVCKNTGGWSDAAAEAAEFYEIARLAEQAYRQGGPLGANELSRFDEFMASEPGATILSWTERQIESGEFDDSDEEISEEDLSGDEMIFLLLFSGALGVTPEDPLLEDAGELLAMVAMQRVAARQFSVFVPEQQ